MDKIILLDKKEGVSSFDAIRRIKKIYDTPKVGHCGTLDPFASGLLIIGINQATKALSLVFEEYKEYLTTITFGSDTDTLDIEGKITSQKDIKEVSIDDVNRVLETFKGNIKQIPPKYSAIHINGRKLYEYARNNEDVIIPERNVFIYNIELINLTKETLTLKIKCSKGTYIRSLGVDIAHALGNDAHLTYLRRLSIGNISIDKANNYNDLLEGHLKEYELDEIINLKTVTLTNLKDLIKMYNGQEIKITCDDDYIFLKDELYIRAIYKKIDTNVYKCDRGLFDENIRLQRLRELKKR